MTDQTIQIVADPKAQQKLTRLLERLQSELGHGAEETVRWAAYYVAKSMGASMRVAPKQRRIFKNDGTDPRHPKGAFVGYVWKWDRAGNRRRVWILAGEDQERVRTIRRRGLARASWLWMVPDLAIGMREPAGMPRMRDVSTATIQGGKDPAVILSDRLRYVISAAKTSGKQAISTAFSRGATAGLRYLDRRLAKAVTR